MKNVSAKKHKEIKQACISLESIIFVYVLLYFSPVAKLWPEKKSFLKFSFFKGTPRP